MSLIAQEVLICHFCNNPITKLSGRGSDSLLMHHITYIPEVKAPTHRSCHTKYHMTHPDHPTNPEAEYRKRLIESLDGDITCFFCGEEITKFGMGSKLLVIHSLDGNHDNWDPENKVSAHKGCHMKYHVGKLRVDPTSVYNSPAYRINHMMACREAWKNPIAIRNKSIAITKSWIKRREKLGHSGFTEDGLLRLNKPGQKKPQIWLTRRERYPSHGVKNPQAYSKSLSKGQKKRWAWGRLARMFEMLFDGIVDEDAEIFPCPHCNRVFSSKFGLRRHISIQHESRESDKLKIIQYLHG